MRWIYVVLGIVLASAVGGLFYIAMQKDTEVVIVTVTLAKPPDNDAEKIISNVNASISYVRKMEVPEEIPLSTPGITVIVSQNKLEKSGWYSVPIPTNTSIYGNYTLIVKPYDKIDRSQPISILTRVVDPNGKDVSVIPAIIKLE